MKKKKTKSKGGAGAGLFLRGFPLLGPIYAREDRLRARLRSLRKQIKAHRAASAERLKAVEAAGAARLKAASAVAAARLRDSAADSAFRLRSIETAASARLVAAEIAAAAKLREAHATSAERLRAAEAASAERLRETEAAGAERLQEAQAAGAERLQEAETTGALRLKVAEAVGRARLIVAEGASAAKLQALEIEKRRAAEKYNAAFKARWDSLWQAACDPDLRQPFLEFVRLVTPRRVVGHDKVRVGRRGDGGYVMLDDLAGVRTAISCGIADEVSWDTDIADRGIDVIQIDYSVDAPPVEHPRFGFRKQRLVGTCEQPQDVTLSSLIESCPGDDQSVICKIDIEGGEWDVFARPVSGLRRCRQIVLEFHRLAEFASPEWRSNALNCLAQITTEHQCIHVHGNNATKHPFVIIGGVPFPSIFEATFVLRDRYDFVEETDAFPTALDSPNYAPFAEISLGLFPGPSA